MSDNLSDKDRVRDVWQHTHETNKYKKNEWMNEYFNLLSKCHHSIVSFNRKRKKEDIKTITTLIAFGLLKVCVCSLFDDIT
jgi:hypothetical protein